MSSESFLDGAYNQVAVYWGHITREGYGNVDTSDPAVEIYVRWEERTELFINALGEEEKSQAVVFVQQDVEVGEYLYLGTLDELDSEPDPTSTQKAFEIRGFKKVPSVDASIFVRKVWL